MSKSGQKSNEYNDRWILTSTILASSMAFIDFSALNVALPALQEDLGMSGSELLWVINSYSLFLSALMLMSGAMGDRYGRKKVFMLGIIIFTSASILCGFAKSGNILITFRAIQGVGASFMMPGSLSLITSLIDPERRGKAIGTWSMFSALTTIIGPALGGWLAGMGWWRMIFFINIPLGIVSLLLLALKVPESKQEDEGKLDFLGALLATIGLAGLTYGFIEAGNIGFDAWPIIISLSGAGVTLLIFIWWQNKSEAPMMPLKLFGNRNFSIANFLTFLLYAALSGFLFFFPLNLIQAQGYPAEVAGFTLLPFAILLASLSRIAGVWCDKIGAKPLLVIGPLITGIAFYLFSLPELTNGPADYWTSYFPAIIVLGVGMGITVAPLTTAVMNSAPREFSGIASAINNTMARSAGVIAVAVMGGLALITFTTKLEKNVKRLDLPNEIKNEIVLGSRNFGETPVPDSLSLNDQSKVSMLINESFVYTFRKMGLIATIMTFAGVIVTYLFYRHKIHSKP